MAILFSIVGSLVVGYLPGAVLFRLPIADRQKRAALAAEERVFWQVLISLSWSVSLVLILAAAGAYRYERLLAANVVAVLVMIAIARGRLLWRGTAAKVTIAALVPTVVLAVGIWRFFPASEYIIGGKDPGIYVNEGVAIDRTGRLFRHDATVAQVPQAARDLFFPAHGSEQYHSLRFMGVFLNNPATGEVIAGWPHLYPASVAIGYRLAGITGATNMVALWATLGLLAVYFFGARLIGRLPSFFAVILLALNVIEVWYGRYPNTEVVMQTMLFAVLLALARAHQDEDSFFGWVAGLLGALLIFLRFDVFLALAGMAAALALLWIAKGTRPRLGFVLPILAGTGLALTYYTGPMKQYFFQYQQNLPTLAVGLGMIAIAAVIVLVLGTQRTRLGPLLVRYLPLAVAGVVILLALYGLFLRQPGGKLTDYDAYTLRTFRDAYVFWPALLAALAGYAMVARREFWRDPAFFLILAGFSVFFFYKIRAVPDHFWMVRRFLPVILPGLLLMASAAAFGSSTPEHRRTVRRAVGAILFLSFIGWQYARAAAPVAAHVEYKGTIGQVHRLAGHFTPRDLIIVEGRGSGDFHVLALPLAYVHGLHVLVLEASPVPDRARFEAFLTDALTKYERVFFVGGGGTDLLSRRVTAVPVAFTPTFKVPEYETTSWDDYPNESRQKDLAYNVYELTIGEHPRRGFVLDVGHLDDLNVVRFYAREVTEGRSFRWTMRQSFVSATGLTGNEREIELILQNGGRPAGAPPATMEVYFNETLLGRLQVDLGFKSYRLAIPAEAARLAAMSEEPARLRLVSSVWSPHDFGGGGDTRELGLMVDRIEIH